MARWWTPGLCVVCALLVSCERTEPAPEPAPEPDSTTPLASADALNSARRAEQPRPRVNGGGWLGTRLGDAPGGSGARVLEVLPDSPADLVDMKPDDIIVSVAGRAVEQPRDAASYAAEFPPGSEIDVRYRRGQRELAAKLKLSRAPTAAEIVRRRLLSRPAPPLDGLTTAAGGSGLGFDSSVTVVEFWASWCTTCRALSGELNAWHATLAERGLRVVGITDETPEVAASVAKQHMRYTVGYDLGGSIKDAYGVSSLPTTFVVDKSGTVRDVMIGYDSVELSRLKKLVESLL